MRSEQRFLAPHPPGTSLMGGGTVGPEGGVFVVLGLILVSLIIVFTLSRKKYQIPYKSG